MRKMVRETRMDKSSLIYPMFVKDGIGIDELSVSPSSVLPLRAELRRSIAKTCGLELLEC